MSFEPTLIISHADFHKAENTIQAFMYKKPPAKVTEKYTKKCEAYKTLEIALKLEGFKISGIRLIIIIPQLTAHNKAVRDALTELNIEFAIDY